MPYAKAINDIRKAYHEAFTPPPELTLSQWADRYAYLSPENSADFGKWHSIAYQRGIMDAVTDPNTTTVTVMKSSRVGWTKIIDHAIGYYIHQDPCPMMVVQPTIDDAEDYSKTEIEPMIRDTPVLTEIMGDYKAKDSGNTIMRKNFPGGRLILSGANSARGFRRVTVRVVMFDEVDGYPIGAGQEGDQIKLGIKRTLTFWNNKILIGSTPTLKGFSRIETSYDASDQRHYFVPCPHCKVKQVLKFFLIKWPKGEPEKAEYQCEHCGRMIEEKWKPWMVGNGEWRASKPFKGHAGFHIWAAYSLFPNASWGKLAEEFLECKDKPEEFKVFVNTVWGECWEERGGKVEDSTLLSRREIYGPEVPDGAGILTAGVDIQGDRLEVEVVAWGLEYESWSMDYRIIYGDPAKNEVWKNLDDYLLAPWVFPDGKLRRIAIAGIDSGFLADKAYTFCKTRLARRIFPVKGKSKPGESMPLVSKPSRNNALRVPLFTIGVDTGKDLIYSRLKTQEPGPGYCHFPADRESEYFKGLTAEKSVTRYKKGRPYKEWILPRGRHNEPLDCRIYATAAYTILRPDMPRILMQLKQSIEAKDSKDTTLLIKRKPSRRIISSGIE